MSSSTDLTFALYHAIAYLTRSLIGRYSATTIDLLHFTLERNVAKQYENNWFPTEPQRGSGRRCLSLSPTGAPPRPIYYACKSARVNWEDWMTCLGGVEMDIFIDPGCVSVRFGKWGTSGVSKLFVIWSATTDMSNAKESAPKKQTVAQSIVDDDDENELFNMIADEIRAPTWMTPILNQFPTVPRPTVVIASPSNATQSAELDSATSTSTTHSSLLSVITRHSRSSSRSSDTGSSEFSFSSAESMDTAATSTVSSSSSKQRNTISRQNATSRAANSVLLPAAALIMQAPVYLEDEDECDDFNTPLLTPNGKTSRRERARQARVHVDSTKTEVTPYDGGKTTVLTGGVMLGMKASAAAPATPSTPRFSATPSAASRKTIWRNAANTRNNSPRVRV
jgi:BTG family